MAAVLRESRHETAMAKAKTLVYKQRISLKDFFQDFDKLKTGYVFENQALMALRLAGLDKDLFPDMLQELIENFAVKETDQLRKVDYRRLCCEVDQEPDALLDKHRYDRCSRVLDPQKEAELDSIFSGLKKSCREKGLMVKPFFDDASCSRNRCVIVNHVTRPQFRQVCSAMLAFELTAEQIGLLIEKFLNPEYPDMVNYVAFARVLEAQ